MPRGRPSELTPDILARACGLASQMVYHEALAPLFGVSRATLYGWLRRGAREQRRRDKGGKSKPNEQIYVDFLGAVKKGRAEAEKRCLAVIEAAARSGQWVAAAWTLERAFPERWGRHTDEVRQLRRLVQKIAEQSNVKIDPVLGEVLPNEQ